MPNITDIMPLSVESEYDRKRKEAAWRRDNAPDFTDLGTAALLQGPVASIYNRVAGSSLFFEPDPSFHWTEKLFNELSDGMDPQSWPQLADAVSYEHAAYIRNMAANRAKYRDQLAAAGVGGQAASIVAGLADPVYLAAGLASGGLGFAAGGSKIAQLTRAGLLSAGAFASIEEFKRAGDPSLSEADVLLAGAAGGLTTVAGGLTAGLPRAARFPIGGIAAAAPGTAYAALSSEEENRSRDVMLNFLPQFFIGGTLASLHPAVREVNGPVDAAARKAMKDQEFDIVKQQAAKMGKPVRDILADDGQSYFSEQLRDSTAKTFADIQQRLWWPAETDPVLHAGTVDLPEDIAHQAAFIRGEAPSEVTARAAWDTAMERLSKVDPAKKLNRSEVNEIMEGTGWKAENQGFPTPDELRRQIETAAEGLTFEDHQRIASQIDYEHPVFVDKGTPPEPRVSFSSVPRITSGADTVPHAETVLNVPGAGTASESANLPNVPRGVHETVATGSPGDSGVPPVQTGSGPAAAVGAASQTDPVFAAWKAKATNVVKFGDWDASGIPYDPSSSMRFSLAGMASRAEGHEFGRFANMTGREDTPKKSGRAYYAGVEQVRDWNHADGHRILNSNQVAFEAYAKSEREAGRTPLQYHEFQAKVADAIENRRASGVALSGNEHIDKAAENQRAVFKDQLERAQRHGVRGALETEHDPHYFPRFTIRDKLDSAIEKFGLKQMLEWAQQDIAAHPENGDLTQNQQLMKARDYLMGAGRQQTLIDAEEANFFQFELAHDMADRFRETNPGITDADIEAIVYKKSEVPEGEGTGAGNASRFRRKIRMVTDNEHVLPDGSTFRFNDVIDRNAERVALQYAKQINGLSVMAEVFRSFSTEPIYSVSADGQALLKTPGRLIENMTQMKKYLVESAIQQGLKPEAFETDLKYAQLLADFVMGKPLSENTGMVRASRIARNTASAVLLNNLTAFRNVTEIGAAMAEPGLGAVLRQVPVLEDFFRSARAGQVKDPLAIELLHAGIILQDMNTRTMPGPEEGDLYISPDNPGRAKREAILRGAERGTRIAANVVNRLSGIAWGQQFIQRIMSKWIAQRWFDIAQSGKLPSVKRMRATNIDEPMARRIIASIKGTVDSPGASYEKSTFGKRLQQFNWSQWKDVEAAAALRQAISKTVNRLVLTADPTQQAPWMTTEGGKFLWQFRNYATAAVDSKTAFNLSMHDRTSLVSFGAQMVSKAIAYVVGTYAYAALRPDRDKYLRDRLGSVDDPRWGTIAKAAFGQAEMASLIPNAVDALQAIRGRGPYFAFSNTTGRGQGTDPWAILTSVPAAQVGNNVLRTIGIAPDKILDFAGHSIDSSHRFDPRITQREGRYIAGGIPMQGFWGIKQGIEHLIRMLPKERK